MPFNTNTIIVDLTKIRGDATERLRSKNKKVLGFVPFTLEDAVSPTFVDGICPIDKKAPYLDYLVGGLDQASEESDFRQVKDSCGDAYTIIWNSAPEMLELQEDMKKEGININAGKGLNVWTSLLYYYTQLQKDPSLQYILHDADIKTYDERFLQSLILPLTGLSYDFVKAYYHRVARNEEGRYEMYGRVLRLSVRPLISALDKVFGSNNLIHEFLEYIGGYNYLLSGEFGMSAKLAPFIPIHPDWGLEIGTVSYLFKRPFKRCQINTGRYDPDIKEYVYDHRHSPISGDDHTRGLFKMAIDIDKAFYRKIYKLGGTQLLDVDTETRLIKAFYEEAEKHLQVYKGQAWISDFFYDEKKEKETMIVFGRAAEEAFLPIRENPEQIEPLPPADDVPHFAERVREIVERYNS